MRQEDEETTLPGRILNWLVHKMAQKNPEDYEAMTTTRHTGLCGGDDRGI